MTILQIVAAVVLIETVLFYAYQTEKGWNTRNSTTGTWMVKRDG